jgi:hypothetical protein
VEVSHEYMIPAVVANVGGNEIDFVFRKRSHVVAMELKYIRSLSSGMTTLSNQRLRETIASLQYINRRSFPQAIGRWSYLVVVGKRELLIALFARKTRDLMLSRLFGLAAEILNYQEDNIFFEQGWRCDEVGERDSEATVLVLRRDQHW